MSKTQIKTDESGIDRRTFLRASAGVIGMATVGGASMRSDRLAPVRESDAACVPCAVAVGVGTVAAAHAGLTVGNKISDFINDDNDAEDVADTSAQNEIHGIASGVRSQRDWLNNQLREQWVKPDADRTPTADAVFTEAEAEAARAITSGDSELSPTTLAQNVVDKHVTIGMFNALQEWNKLWLGGEDNNGMLGALVAAEKFDTGQVNLESYSPASKSTFTDQNISPIESTKLDNGNYCAGKGPVTGFPMDPANIDDLPDTVEAVVLPGWHGPYNIHSSSIQVGSGPTMMGNMSSNEITHPDRSNVSPIYDIDLWHSHLAKFESIQSNLITQVETYVTELDQQLAEGIIEPNSIISPTTLVEEFADSDEMTRAAAYLAASGAHIPQGDLSFRVKVSHPKIKSEHLWGKLFVRYAKGVDPVSLAPGVTVTASQYDVAFLTFKREDNGETDELMLTPDAGDIQILDVADISEDKTQDATEGAEGEASASGKVYIWTLDELAPDPVRYPESHSNWKVQITGDVNQDTVPVTNVLEDETGYYVEGTSIEDGETIEDVRLIQALNMTKSSDYIHDPANVNEEQMKERLKTMKELREEIRSLEDTDLTGGGGLMGFGSVGGKVRKAIAGVIVFMVGLAGLNAASG